MRGVVVCGLEQAERDVSGYLAYQMSIPVLLFASYADAFGARRLEVPLEAPCQVADLVRVIRTMPGGDRLPAAPLVAVNRTWVPEATAVNVGDEIALIPPVAGG
ncbi:MAG: hypothetical protein RL409_1919 [Gemmatimonadota bacterium]